MYPRKAWQLRAVATIPGLLQLLHGGPHLKSIWEQTTKKNILSSVCKSGYDVMIHSKSQGTAKKWLCVYCPIVPRSRQNLENHIHSKHAKRLNQIRYSEDPTYTPGTEICRFPNIAVNKSALNCGGPKHWRPVYKEMNTSRHRRSPDRKGEAGHYLH